MVAEEPAAPRARPLAYIYATVLVRDRNRFKLGLPRFAPPSSGSGWELCGVSYVREGLIVSWRCLSHIDEPPAKLTG